MKGHIWFIAVFITVGFLALSGLVFWNFQPQYLNKTEAAQAQDYRRLIGSNAEACRKAAGVWSDRLECSSTYVRPDNSWYTPPVANPVRQAMDKFLPLMAVLAIFALLGALIGVRELHLEHKKLGKEGKEQPTDRRLGNLGDQLESCDSRDKRSF